MIAIILANIKSKQTTPKIKPNKTVGAVLFCISVSNFEFACEGVITYVGAGVTT
jgi:hypothetical protein